MGVRDTIAKALMGIKAYHSSPHTFDRFDLSKIGTGEGAQVYGHGLYFAENPKVSGQGGEYWNQFLRRFEGTSEGHAAGRLRAEGWDREKALAAAQRDAADWEQLLANARPDQTKYFTQMRDMRRGEAELLASGAPVGPRTYEVEIKADPVRFLDWDKPLIEQSPAVQNAVEPFAQSKWGDSGASLYRSSGLPRHPVAASRVLSEAGIPGIKYLDEGSRNLASNIAQADSIIAAGGVRGRGASSIDDWVKQKAEWQQTPQTSNYVVFNPDIVDIKKMYGFAGAPGAAAAAMGSTYDPSQYEVTP